MVLEYNINNPFRDREERPEAGIGMFDHWLE